MKAAHGDRLRIAYVVHDYNRHGGHSRYVAELATRFRHEHDVHVFTNTVDDPDTAGITFHHVPAYRRNALASILSFVVPATVLVRGRFDVVHAQGLCGLRHTVATAHFCQSAWFEALSKQGVRLTWRQQTFKHLVTGLERRALCQPRVRKVIAVSKMMKNDLVGLYRRSAGVEVIYHGTDTVTFHPDNRDRYRALVRREMGAGESQFVALYVGDLKKGASAAIQAVARTAGVTLWLVSGSNPTDWQALAEKEGVTKRVVFCPHVKRVERYFAAVDAFLFPTVYDPFGLVICEAMASRLPVVTSRMAGAAELITSGANGLLTDQAWEIDQIAEHLAQLRDDSGLRARLGEAARAKVEPLTWDRTAAETLEVYFNIQNELS